MNTDYQQLSPDLVIDAVESLGVTSDFRVLALNSYENRVYQVGIEGEQPLIAKFYRPLRWSDAQIQEEHDFSLALYDLDIPVVPPLLIEGTSLLEHGGFRFSVYPRRGGHAPELDNNDHLEIIGRLLGRIHALGKLAPFKLRPTIDVASFGTDSRDFLLSNDFLPKELLPAYESVSRDLLERIDNAFDANTYQNIRLHGDCHGGNLLWRNDCAHFVDFDDARNGPAIQDLWMLLSGNYQERCLQISDILAGYTEFCDFDPVELTLIEPLRGLRLLHYCAWLARRWDDPAFPMHFPWFNTERYWADHILSLREQMAVLQEPCLQWL
ncbi:MAG: serine/threonine protein kinase [Cellvibrionaceae bacterium]|nr:serine/threonine protein kinase [Cellvibrionaceae bacterium]